MTALAKRKTQLRFETAEYVQGRALVVKATPNTCILRQKGKRTAYEVSWSGIFWLAAKIASDKLRQERRNRKRGLS